VDASWPESKTDEAAVDPLVLRRRTQAFDVKYAVHEVELIESRELRRGDSKDGSTLHLEFDVSALKTRPPYKTAENLGIHPRQPFRLVARLAKRLGVHPSATFSLERMVKEDRRKAPVPSPCTVRDALLWHFDISAAPRPSYLEVLSSLASDTDEKLRLQHLSQHKVPPPPSPIWAFMRSALIVSVALVRPCFITREQYYQ
jgi:sulfite reductase alpha subunit-like flavoprotein